MLIPLQDFEAHRQRLRDRGQDLPRTFALAPILDHDEDIIDSSKYSEIHPLTILKYAKNWRILTLMMAEATPPIAP